MKKIISLLLTLVLVISVATSLFSCQKDPAPQTETTTVKIGYFAGTTGLGMAKMIHDNNASYKFTSYTGPDTIIPAFARGEIDIAALPTNAAPKVFTSTQGKAQLLAINTLGVLHICTNNITISSLNDLAGKTIYVPEAAPKLVLKHVLDTAGVQNYTLNEEYNLDTLPNAIAQGIVDIALLPEPKVTVAQNQYKKLQTESGTNETKFAVPLDISVEWGKVSSEPLVQGCVIVNPAFAAENPEAVAKFLADYEASVSYMKAPENLDSAAQIAASVGILPNAVVAKNAIPRSNITFMVGDAMKNAAIGFYAALNIANPGDAFYYIPTAN